jgi:hypothetical protein
LKNRLNIKKKNQKKDDQTKKKKTTKIVWRIKLKDNKTSTKCQREEKCQGEKLRKKLWGPEIVLKCKTTKEIIQSILRPSLLLSIYNYCKFTVSWKKNRKKRWFYFEIYATTGHERNC